MSPTRSRPKESSCGSTSTALSLPVGVHVAGLQVQPVDPGAGRRGRCGPRERRWCGALPSGGWTTPRSSRAAPCSRRNPLQPGLRGQPQLRIEEIIGDLQQADQGVAEAVLLAAGRARPASSPPRDLLPHAACPVPGGTPPGPRSRGTARGAAPRAAPPAPARAAGCRARGGSSAPGSPPRSRRCCPPSPAAAPGSRRRRRGGCGRRGRPAGGRAARPPAGTGRALPGRSSRRRARRGSPRTGRNGASTPVKAGTGSKRGRSPSRPDSRKRRRRPCSGSKVSGSAWPSSSRNRLGRGGRPGRPGGGPARRAPLPGRAGG